MSVYVVCALGILLRVQLSVLGGGVFMEHRDHHQVVCSVWNTRLACKKDLYTYTFSHCMYMYMYMYIHMWW